MYKKKSSSKEESSTSQTNMENMELDLKQIAKDIEFLGSPYMTWKERKELENRRVVSLGGKPIKKQRVPLSIARVTMKKQKQREQKMLEEGMALGRFGGKLVSSSGSNKVGEKRKAEDMVLKSSVGHFRNGTLNVKHLLRGSSSRDNENTTGGTSKGKKRGGGKKNQGKKKGGKKRR